MESYQIIEKFCKPWEERALLSYCIADIEFFYTLLSSMDTKDFLDPEHQILYSLFINLYKNGVNKFDLAIIIKEAKDLGIIEQVGGVDFIKSLYNMKISKENFKLILEKVLESSLKYKLYTNLEENCSLLLNETSLSGEDLIGKVESSILDLSTISKAVKEPQDLSVGLSELIEQRRQSEVILSGLSTGYSILDKLIDGLLPGTLNVLAARKKMGKSALLTNIALNTAFRLRIPVLYVDTEMSYNEFRDRSIASLAGVRERVVKHGGYTDEQYNRICKAGALVGSGLLFHERMPGYTVDKLVALYKKFKYKHNIGLAVFDYIKEPDSSSVSKNRKEYQILGDVTTKLKDLAGTLDIPFLAAVQLNRDLDVADSDRVARYADIVAHWSTRSEKERQEHGFGCGSHKLIIKDSRRGGITGDAGIGYYFFKDQLRIKEVPIEKQLIKFTGETVDEYSAKYEFSDEELI